ncbi:MAG: DUF6088 family protein [Castellaniella sp.]|uniref:type IV toxin-antitoxin system AbiEi family antitoxin n=1 Tax=Castellaniella sp. TaxID=1955812 RepID=UPI002A369608|nr:DUF6088 family protein [Castellaniella sp.]MDY0309836.1 DUF6088 family protein [Castellaniella sp.]
MNQHQALRVLRALDDTGRYVFRRQHLRACFHEESEKTFAASLARLVETGILIRAARGVYVHDAAKSRDSYTIERVAIALRPADLNYISLESALSEYGVISQIPMDRITLMTTGREGEIRTPYGTIEFVHTKRDPADLRQATISTDRPLRMARAETALRDLRRVGRNLHLVDPKVLEEVLAST